MSYRIKIAGHPRHKVTGAISAVEFHILTLDLIVEHVPYTIKNTLGHFLIGHAVQIDYHDSYDGQPDHGYKQIDKYIAVKGKILCRILSGQEFIHYT